MPEHSIDLSSQGATQTINDLGQILALMSQIKAQGGPPGIGAGIGGMMPGVGPGGVPIRGGGLGAVIGGEIRGAAGIVGRTLNEIAPGYGRAAAVGMNILGLTADKFFRTAKITGLSSAIARTTGGQVIGNEMVLTVQQANERIMQQLIRQSPFDILRRGKLYVQPEMFEEFGMKFAGFNVGYKLPLDPLRMRIGDAAYQAIGKLSLAAKSILLTGAEVGAAIAPAALMLGAYHVIEGTIRDIKERNHPGNFVLGIGDIVASNRPESFRTEYRDFSTALFSTYARNRSFWGKTKDIFTMLGDRPIGTIKDFIYGNYDRAGLGMTPESVDLASEVAHHAKYLNSKGAFYGMLSQTLNDAHSPNPPSPMERDQIYRAYNREAYIEFHPGYQFEERERKYRIKGRTGVN
jgi:hypothetical protein